jgi:1,4-alpha-glucan branching enzyme
VIARLEAYRAERSRPGLVCCALDAELLGHWWYEGPVWLGAVFREARAQGLELVTLPAALERAPTVERELAASSWGLPRDLTTWDAPPVAELAFEARRAELELVAVARAPSTDRAGEPSAALARAARELLALQASDWAFLMSRGLASDYPLERSRGHRAALDAALRALRDCRAAVPSPELRNLAPALDLTPLLAA